MIDLKNPFQESFRIESYNSYTKDPVDLVYCASCNQISDALVLEKGRHRYHCPVCEKRIIKKFNKTTSYITKVYSNVLQSEEKLVFSCGFRHYILKFDFDKNKMRKLSLFYEYNITYNTKTKHTYLVRKSKKRKNNLIANITFGCIPMKWSFIVSHLEYIAQDETFQNFVNQLLPSWFSFSENLKVTKIPLYKLYPQLMNLPTEISTHGKFRDLLKKNKQKRKELVNLSYKQKDIVDWAVGATTTKMDRKIIYDVPNLFFLQKFLSSLFTNDDVRQNVLQKLSLILKDKKSIEGLEYFVEDLFGIRNQEFQIDELYLIKEYLPDEKRFAHAFIRYMECYSEHYGGLSHINLVYFADFFKDINRMIEEIHMQTPDYQVPAIYDFHRLHDVLIKEHRKLSVKYQEIKYLPEESECLEYQEGNYKFELAKSNHQLFDVGMDLDICVGSYGGAAISKKLYIVLVKSEVDNKITYCLEVRGKRKLKIVQAKGKYNSRPDDEMNKIILNYCKEKGIVVNSMDLKSEKVD